MHVNADKWFAYADENLAVARLALEGGFLNAALQNMQQAVEKYLKSALLGRDMVVPKTHNIEMLRKILLEETKTDVGLTEEDCELLDAVYIPSKYPMGSALPDYQPDEVVCRSCLRIAEAVRTAVQLLL